MDPKQGIPRNIFQEPNRNFGTLGGDQGRVLSLGFWGLRVRIYSLGSVHASKVHFSERTGCGMRGAV